MHLLPDALSGEKTNLEIYTSFLAWATLNASLLVPSRSARVDRRRTCFSGSFRHLENVEEHCPFLGMSVSVGVRVLALLCDQPSPRWHHLVSEMSLVVRFGGQLGSLLVEAPSLLVGWPSLQGRISWLLVQGVWCRSDWRGIGGADIDARQSTWAICSEAYDTLAGVKLTVLQWTPFVGHSKILGICALADARWEA